MRRSPSIRRPIGRWRTPRRLSARRSRPSGARSTSGFATPRATFEDFMAHLLHALKVAGVDHVGVGIDFDGGGGVTGLE